MTEHPPASPGEEPGDAPPPIQASNVPESEDAARAEDLERARHEHLRVVKDAAADSFGEKPHAEIISDATALHHDSVVLPLQGADEEDDPPSTSHQ